MVQEVITMFLKTLPINRRCIFFGILAVFNCIFLIYFYVGIDRPTYHINRGYEYCENISTFIHVIKTDDGKIPRCTNKNNCNFTRKYLKDQPIFLVETAGSARLNVRQACAVESTARHNPSTKIYVLMTPTDEIDSDHDLMRKLYSIENVKLLQVDIEDLFADSPLSEWYSRGKWKKSEWKISHMSDGIRFFLLWKYGGAYVDMDVITFRSFIHLRNSVSAEKAYYVGSAALFFDKGHELMRRCVFDFAENYDPDQFAANGPQLLDANIRKYCDASEISNVSESRCGINILPPEAVFPIPWENWEEYFAPVKEESDIFSVFNASYMIHVWNKLSKNLEVKVGSNTLYELAMERNCPLAYSYAETVGFI